MNDNNLAFHYVCTRQEAEAIIDTYSRFWVANCGCRESKGQCDRSRVDVCLMFRDDIGSSGTGLRELSRKDVDDILSEAQEKHLVPRPFRNQSDKTKADGICFCCDDCCGYFLSPEEVCDKGSQIEKTDIEKCTACGSCVDVCYFGARKMDDEALAVVQDSCYGCGLCVDVCSEGCVEMTRRA